VTAQYLKLDDSVMFNITGAERYAVAACVSSGLMRRGALAGDYVSGPELIEIMGKISERTEAGDEN
jgi:hypothetical protein